jgi:site-specific DNA recombinase
MSPKSKPKRPIDIYCRVSRVAGRDVQADGGTASEQEKRCRLQLGADGLEAGQVFTDLDQSGAKESRPAFDKAMQRARDGLSGGIIVLNLRRFGRRLSVVRDVLDLEEHGAAFISCEERIDTSSPSGRFMLSVFAALAQMELEERKEGWDRARAGAVSRGVHVAAYPPAGYARDEAGKLIPNGGADQVRAVFLARAKGASLRECSLMLEGVRTATGREGKWSIKATRGLLSNRVYLGEARSGEFVTPDAHEALVTPGTFARVRAVDGAKRKGEYAAKKPRHPLSGLVRCASCGGVMKRDSTRRKGKLYWFWRCCNSKDLCDAGATIGLPILDAYVEEWAVARIMSHDAPSIVIPDLRHPTVDDGRLEAALLEAENELAAYVDAMSVVDVGAEVFRHGLQTRQEAVQSAREALTAATPRVQPEIPPELEMALRELPDEFRLVEGGLQVSGPDAVAEAWAKMPDVVKGYVYGKVFERIDVRPGRLPAEEKVALLVQPPDEALIKN